MLFRVRDRTAFAAPSVVVSASDGDIQRAQRRPVDHRQTRWHRTKKSRSLSPVKQFPARIHYVPATAVFSPPVSPSPRRALTVRHRSVSSPPPPPPPVTNRLIRAIVFANGANRKQNGGTVPPLDFSLARSISIITITYNYLFPVLLFLRYLVFTRFTSLPFRDVYLPPKNAHFFLRSTDVLILNFKLTSEIKLRGRHYIDSLMDQCIF